MMRLALLALLPLGACGPDLPADWADATPVDTLTQTPCAGSPYEEHDEHVEGDLSASPVEVSLKQGHFRCEQDVEGFYRVAGGGLEVLVQPIDMDPRIVAGCDCLFDIDMTVSLDVDLAPDRATVFRRWDNLNDDNVPIEIGTLLRD